MHMHERVQGKVRQSATVSSMWILYTNLGLCMHTHGMKGGRVK
jgi:hypothetical protein